MWEAIVDAMKALIPSIDSAAAEQYLWRLRMAIVSCSAFLGLCAITALAFGVVPGFDGFARKADLSTISNEMNRNHAENIETALLDLRIKHCKAATDESKQLYWSKISHLLVRYQELTTRVYAIPSCTDI